MLCESVVGDLSADQRVTHFLGAIADTIRRRHSKFWLHQAHAQLARRNANPILEGIVNNTHLVHHAQIALRIALVANHANRGFVNQLQICTKLPCNAISLRISARVLIDQNGLRILHHYSDRVASDTI